MPKMKINKPNDDKAATRKLQNHHNTLYITHTIFAEIELTALLIHPEISL